MLHVNDLVLHIAGRRLFDGATCAIPAGHRVGLVGRNGAGKTTLFRLIRGELHPDGGRVRIRPNARIGFVAQEAPGGALTPLDAVLAADAERTRLLAEAEHSDGHRAAEAHARLAEIGAHAAPARAAAILAGLGFDAAAQARPLAEFSGGWRMRVALAAALFAEPDLLLLDEPTNHLDLEAALWLEGHLRAYPHTLLLISHDRTLLNTAVDHILHLQAGKLTLYRGGYDSFERQRRERLAQAQALRDRQETQRRHLQAFVDRFRAKATKARQAQSRLKMLARLEPIAAAIEEPSVAFRLPEPEALAPPILTLENAAAGYAPDAPVLRRLNLRIDMDDRIALLGANGNGKSTLARMLAGRLAPLEGQLARSPKLKVGYFAQHQLDELDPDRTPTQHLAPLMPDAPEDRVRARLGQFGLVQDLAETKVAALSGGEKARLALALATHAAPQLLILDEPTNHLDVDAREALVQALNDFTGAVVLVSHDRHMVELCADRLWLVADGGVAPFEGDLDDYARLVAERRRSNGEARPRGSEPSRRDQRRAAAESRAAQAPLRRQARDAERLVEQLSAERAKLDAELADPKVYAEGGSRLAELGRRRAELERRLEEAEEAWLAAAAALEADG